MKIGVISFAHGHAYSYADSLMNHQDVELTGIFDEDQSRGEKAAELYDTVYFSNYEELLNTDIEAVVITSENSKHLEHVLASAVAGKHILCEKPIATKVEDAEKMIESCKENGVILQTAFPVRFSTPIRRAKQVLDQGGIGEVLAVKATNRGTNPGGWFVDKSLSGGGAVLDHTVHVVDILRWFLAEDVTNVYAEVGNLFSEDPIDDSGVLSMEFENGVFATLDCSWSRNETYPTWGDVTIEVIGSEGNLSIDAFDQKINVYNEQGANWEFWGDDMNDVLVSDFIETISKGKSPFITGEDGLKALEVALAAYRSAEEQRVIHY